MTDRQARPSARTYPTRYHPIVDMPSLPTGLRAFIARHIPSMVHLEILLLLSRDARRTWTAREAAVAVRCALERATMALESLSVLGLLRRAETGQVALFSYEPTSADLRAHVVELDTLERQRPVTLIRAVHEIPLDDHAFVDARRPEDQERDDDDA